MTNRFSRHWLASAIVIGLLFFTAIGNSLLMAAASALALVALAVLYREDLRQGMLPRAVAATVLAGAIAAAIAFAMSTRPAG